MLYELAIFLLKVGGGMLLLLILRAIQLNQRIQATLKRFQEMGIPAYPGCDKFLMGPIMEIATEYEKATKTEVRRMMPIFGFELLSENKNPGPLDVPFDASKYPIMSFTFLGSVQNYICDPKMIQEIYTTHNESMDKHEMNQDFFQYFGNEIFAFMPTNDTWKAQRAACRHMFFKSKLATMVTVTKNHINYACKKWLSEIEANGEARIDITVEFERIFAHAINNIAFGSDMNDDKFDFFYYDKVTDTYVERKCSFREAIGNQIQQVMAIYMKRMGHPISGPVKILFGVEMDFGTIATNIVENKRRIDAKILKIVVDRRNGVTKSEMGGDDLLACFLERPDVFNDQHVVDSLKGLIFAGSDTTHYATQTIISHLCQNKQTLGKIRQELVEKVFEPAIEEDPSLAQLAPAELLDKTLTLETTLDLEYTSWVMQEALRISPPAASPGQITCRKPLKIGNFNFEKGDNFVINIQAMGHNPAEWQRPMEFLPERFDNSNELSLTPSGKKRSMYSLGAWHGGSRVCFGKTLAEANGKSITAYMADKFEMKLEDPKYETKLPLSQMHQSSFPSVWVKLTARKR